jgi:hypothetical protein
MNHFTTLTANPSQEDFEYFMKVFSNELILGRDGLGIFEGLPEPKKTYDDAVDRLKEYFQPRTSILAERRSLF